ncbi:unnamed protein product [Meganyctiphanes norvegica]|uniref:Uncharacterized protein n=1 Tax=Meganyctiphanes norvegica TaxID=48144 RepID=A0AAV2PWY5_MEGNR
MSEELLPPQDGRSRSGSYIHQWVQQTMLPPSGSTTNSARGTRGRDRSSTMDSMSSRPSQDGNGSSVTSFVTNRLGNRQRRTSMSSSIGSRPGRKLSTRVEVVPGPGGPVLVEIDEEIDGEEQEAPRRPSIKSIRSYVVPDTSHIDKALKIEMAHHSPAIGDSKTEDKSHSGADHRPDIEDDPLEKWDLRRWMRHLHLAFTTPALYRLPHLVHKYNQKSKEGSSGGFLMAYIIMLICVAMPLAKLEMTMAQFSSLGPITIFRCLPILTGVGVGMVVTCYILMLYSSTLAGWSLFYVTSCFEGVLPWTSCATLPKIDDHYPQHCTNISTTAVAFKTYIPADFYFQHTVLGNLPDTIEPAELPSINLSLMGILLCIWPIMFFIMIRREIWKDNIVSWMMSLVGIIVLIVLMVKGLSLEHGSRGLNNAFSMNFSSSNLQENMSHPSMWLDALGQALLSLGPAIGLLISRCSYNRFRHRIGFDVYTSTLYHILLGILVCAAIFPYKGDIDFNSDINYNINKNPGFFFVMSSYALTYMSVPQLGGVCLFLTLSFSLIMQTLMLGTTVATTLTDIMPAKWRIGARRVFIDATVCVSILAFNFLFISKNGIFYISTLDAYLPWLCGLSLATAEVLGLVYVYRAENIGKHFRLMLRRNTFFVYIWWCPLPLVLVGLTIWTTVIAAEGKLKCINNADSNCNPINWIHNNDNDLQEYNTAGWVLAATPVVVALAATLWIIYTHRKNLHALVIHGDTWGPALERHHHLYTPGLLQLKSKSPFLVVQLEGGEGEELPEKGWIPFGYYWKPSKTMAANLVDGFATDTITREKLAKYLQTRFGRIHFNDSNSLLDNSVLENKNESQEQRNPNILVTTTSTDENSYTDRSPSAFSDKLSTGRLSPHATSVSSGVVLQPSTLLKPNSAEGHKNTAFQQ